MKLRSMLKSWRGGRRVALAMTATLALWSLFGPVVKGDPYSTAIVTDPFPEMKNPCHGPGCRGGGGGERKPLGVILDCSGRKGGAAHSLREAVKRVPVNGEILIMGAPRGRTCIADGVVINKPMTIKSYDAVGSAYIEGAPGSSFTSPPNLRDSAIKLQAESNNLTSVASYTSACTDKAGKSVAPQILALAADGRSASAMRVDHDYERTGLAQMRDKAPALKARAEALLAAVTACTFDQRDIVKFALNDFISTLTKLGAYTVSADGASCLEVELPVGDALNIFGVNFVVRGGKVPCVRVRAGLVHVQRSKIDSRGTRWAFDVTESGRLVLEDSKIETDGGGVHARRASVELRRVDIQLERGRRGIGASLLGADGVVSDLNVIGGEVGLVASAGSRGLTVERPVVSDAGVGIQVVGQAGQGTVSVRSANIQRSIVGAWFRQNARAELLGGAIAQSERVGVFINNSGATVRGLSHVDGGTYAVAITTSNNLPQNTAPMPELTSLCGERLTGNENDDGYGDQSSNGDGGPCNYLGELGAALQPLDSSDTSKVTMSDPSPLGVVEIDGNTLGPAGTAVIKLAIDGDSRQTIRITNNLLDCHDAKCMSGVSHRSIVESRGNRCAGGGGWFGSSCK